MCRLTEISKGYPHPALFPNYSILKVKAAGTSETSAPFYKKKTQHVMCQQTVQLKLRVLLVLLRPSKRTKICLRFTTQNLRVSPGGGKS